MHLYSIARSDNCADNSSGEANVAEATVSTLEQRKQRWRDFYDMTKPQRHMFLIYYNDGTTPPQPHPYPENKQERIDWAWDNYERQLARTEWLDDDWIPHIKVFTGTEIFAEAFGCKVHRPPDSNPSAIPMIRSASEVSKIKVPDLGSSTLAMLFDIADELRRRGGPEATLKMADIQSPMDIAALIWDKNTFYVGILDAPEAVKKLADKTRQLLVAFLDEWFSRYGEDYVAHYPEYYFPKGITLSEDEVGSVNAEMFDEFFLPHLEELSSRYGGIGIHCCANARHQWPHFKKIPMLRLLNLVQPEDELRDAYKYFAGHTTQMHCWCGDGEPETWPAQYPPDARVVMFAGADSREKAIEILSKLRGVCE